MWYRRTNSPWFRISAGIPSGGLLTYFKNNKAQFQLQLEHWENSKNTERCIFANEEGQRD